MANITKSDLEHTHPEYDTYSEDWKFHRDSYYGGSQYRKGGYLEQHPYESAENFARRKATAYFYNYCSPIVDIFVSYLFREEPIRDYGTLGDNPLFENFLKDSDLDNTSFNQFMREAQRFASIYGRVNIVVDKPSVDPLTQAEAQSEDIRPYLSLVTPENLVDWEYTRQANGKTILSMAKIKEGNKYRIWTREDWELWEIDGEEQDSVTLLASGDHDLGIVPIVTLYNRKSHIRMIGLSDIEDIADINRNIYYLCSDAREIIENTAFPMLAMPFQKPTITDPTVTGSANIMQFDPTEPNAKPFWLEAPHSSLKEIREWVMQDVDQIHRIAKLGGVKGTQNEGAVKSGVALEIENQQLEASLSEKADNVEQAEEDILTLWALWEDTEFDGSIDYPDDFGFDNLSNELDNVIKSQSVRIDSKTFDIERQLKVVDGLMPDLAPEIRKVIDAEIKAGSVSDITNLVAGLEVVTEQTTPEEVITEEAEDGE